MINKNIYIGIRRITEVSNLQLPSLIACKTVLDFNMPPVSQEDELDTIVNIESNFHAEGAADSQDKSAKAGHEDGRKLGWTAGCTLSTELSFYHGAAQAVLTLAETHPSKIADKAIATARRLADQSETVLLHRVGNAAHVDMQAHAEAMRTLFRTSMAQAGLMVRYDRGGSRLSDLSF